MAFTAKIAFTGICALVPNTDKTAKDKRAAIVIPNAWHEKPIFGHSIGDKEPLRRHRCFVKFRLQDLATAGDVPEGSEGVAYMEGVQLSIDCDNDKDNPFRLSPKLSNVASLVDVAKNYSKIEKKFLKKRPKKEYLAARAFLNKGCVTSGPPLSKWVFPGTLGANAKRVPLSHEIVIEYKNLNWLRLTYCPFGSNKKEVLELKAKRKLLVTIANLCDDNPLGWNTALGNPMPADGDFRWYFECVEDKKALRKKLCDALPLPIPYNVDEGMPLAQGVNCFPAVTQAQKF